MERAMLKMSVFFRFTGGMTDAECGRYVRDTFAAFDEERRGVTPLADYLLDEAESYISKQRETGRLGGLASAKKRQATLKAPSRPLDAPSTPLEPPLTTLQGGARPPNGPFKGGQPITEHTITEHTIAKTGIHPDTRAHAREAGEKPPQAAIPHSAAPARPVGAAKAANPPQHPPQPAPPPETPPAARNAVDGKPSGSGGGSRTGNGSAKPTPSGKAKSPFSWADLSEDKQRYVWTIAPTLLPQFAVWFCQEPDNEKAKAIYEKFCARFGAEPFRILLDKFVASVFAGEEPDNRGAAFMATVMAEGSGRQAELAKTGNKQNNQNKGENK